MDDLQTKPSALSKNEVEEIELLTMRWMFQATVDFGTQALTIRAKEQSLWYIILA